MKKVLLVESLREFLTITAFLSHGNTNKPQFLRRDQNEYKCTLR